MAINVSEDLIRRLLMCISQTIYMYYDRHLIELILAH